MKMDVRHDREGHVKFNPSWFIQTGIVILLSVIAYFIDGSLNEIKDELEFSRIERAQLRADLTSFQIGATGDRFTNSEWRQERGKIERDLDDIRERLTRLEAKGD
jgi:hypothetical protein